MVLAVINADAYPFLAYSDLTCHLEDTGIGSFWLSDSKETNSEVETEGLPHQQVKTLGSFSTMFVHGCASIQLYLVVQVFLRSLGVIC